MLGRAGSGKTSYIIDSITEQLKAAPDGDPIIFLVPEQATFQMEQAILRRSDISGFSRLHILSFQRLSQKVLEEQGGIAKADLSDTGKEMIIKNILLQRKDDLEILEKVAVKSGFSEKLSRLISEARMYEITPEMLEQISQELDLIHLKQKLQEISQVFTDYETFLQHQGYHHQEDRLSKAGQKMEGNNISFLAGSTCYIDGFSGFTPQELKLLEGLLTKCSNIELALTLPPQFTGKIDDELHLFHPTLKTYNQVWELAVNNDIEIKKSKHFPNENEEHRSASSLPRFKDNPALAHLEKEWGKNKINPYDSEPTGLSIVEGTNLRNEIDKIAREIKLLVRDHGMRYKDIAVIVRELESYEPVIKAVFNDYKIPHFLDRKEPVHHHPLVEFLRSSVETVISNWDYEPLFRMLKTGLLPISSEEIFQVENYVLAHGISGKDWKKQGKWNFIANFDLERENIAPSNRNKQYLSEINSIKGKVRDTLLEFDSKLRGINKSESLSAQFKNQEAEEDNLLSVREISTYLWELIEQLQIEYQLEEWSLEAEERKDFVEMQLHNQLWDTVIDLLDQMVTFLGEQKVTLSEYLQIIESGLANIKLGLLPATLDQVLVGTADRSRYHEIKVLFMAGVSDGLYPAKIDDDGIIDDRERITLRQHDVEFAPTTEQKLYQEQYLIYNVLTQPSQKLYLSYPAADSEGRTMSPSTIISDIQEMFPELFQEYQNDGPENDEDFRQYIIDGKKAVSNLIKLINKVGHPEKLAEDKQQLLAYLINEHPDLFYSTPEIKALDYKKSLSPLTQEVIDKLYPNKIATSVSGLESFCQCPFRHFAEQNLRLKEREYFRLEPASLGLFYHAGLKLFWDKLQENNLTWHKLKTEEREALVSEIVEVLSERLKNRILLASERYKYFKKKLHELLSRAVEVLSWYSDDKGFYPVGSEIGFGKDEPLSTLELELPSFPNKKVQLKGRIDRIDTGKKDGDLYLRVIDYKGKSKNLELRDLYYGLDLQLAAYMTVAMRNSDKLTGDQMFPGGMLYFGVENPVVPTDKPVSPAQARDKLKSTLKMRGYLIDDEEVLDLMTREDENSQDLLPYKLRTSSPGFYKNSKVLSEQEFLAVLNYTESKLVELAERVLSGEIAPYPYKDGGYSACTYCPYLAVCQFDLNYKEHKFWNVPAKGDYLSLILEEMEEVKE